MLSFKDITNQRPPKDAPSAAEYFMYQTLNYRMDIRGLSWGNRFVQTRTELARSGFSWNRYNRNGPKTEPLLTLHITTYFTKTLSNTHPGFHHVGKTLSHRQTVRNHIIDRSQTASYSVLLPNNNSSTHVIGVHNCRQGLNLVINGTIAFNTLEW